MNSTCGWPSTFKINLAGSYSRLISPEKRFNVQDDWWVERWLFWRHLLSYFVFLVSFSNCDLRLRFKHLSSSISLINVRKRYKITQRVKDNSEIQKFLSNLHLTHLNCSLSVTWIAFLCLWLARYTSCVVTANRIVEIVVAKAYTVTPLYILMKITASNTFNR